jgi:hypothetical protein
MGFQYEAIRRRSISFCQYSKLGQEGFFESILNLKLNTV